MSWEKFRDNLRFKYGLIPQDIPATCDGWYKKFPIKQDLSCPKGGLVLARLDNAAKEWGNLGARALVPSAIAYKPKINSRTVQGGGTGAGARQDSGAANGSTDNVRGAQGGSGQMVNGAVRLVGELVQVEVPEESREDISAHGFLKRGTTTMFDMQIVNLGVSSCLHMTPEKALEKADK